MLLFGDLDCRDVIGSPLRRRRLLAPLEGCPVPPDRRQHAQRSPLRDRGHSGDVDHSSCGARTVYRAYDEEELRG